MRFALVSCPRWSLLLIAAGLADARALTVTLLRHGETEWNVQGRLQGSSDSPLTPRGVAQARACGHRLKDRRFAAAYASPMPRARRTAELILAELKVPPVLQEEPRLRERAFGVWEGLEWYSIEKLHGESLRRANRDAAYTIPGGGESRQETLDRVLEFLRSLTTLHASNDAVLVVTHSGTATSLIKEVLGLRRESPRTFDVRNLAINVLEYVAGKGKWKVQTLGDCAHLKSQ